MKQSFKGKILLEFDQFENGRFFHDVSGYNDSQSENGEGQVIHLDLSNEVGQFQQVMNCQHLEAKIKEIRTLLEVKRRKKTEKVNKNIWQFTFRKSFRTYFPKVLEKRIYVGQCFSAHLKNFGLNKNSGTKYDHKF